MCRTDIPPGLEHFLSFHSNDPKDAASAGEPLIKSVHDDPYSLLSACIGSTDAARRAGMTEAAEASRNTEAAASTITSGSKGLTPKRNERNSPEAAAAPPRPRTQPAAASLRPEAKTRRMIPERCDPSAMRIAISRSREATENAAIL